MGSFDGKTILITGASSGIGKACAVALAQEGAGVVLVARSEEKLQEVANLIGENAYIYPYDLLELEGIKNIFQFCRDNSIKLDGLVHCAGMLAECPIKAIRMNMIEDAMKLHCYSFVELGKNFYSPKHSNEGGSIVAISSISSELCDMGMGPYSASKAALNAFVKTMSKEFMRRKIRVNALLPAGVETPMTIEKRTRMGVELHPTEDTSQPLGIISPENIAENVMFLLSDKAKYTTGALIPISAGL